MSESRGNHFVRFLLFYKGIFLIGWLYYHLLLIRRVFKYNNNSLL